MGAQKRKTAYFRLKSHFAEKKSQSATKFLCVKTVGGKVVRHGKNDWWGPLVHEILDQTDRVEAKSPIFDLFSLLATQP